MPSGPPSYAAESETSAAGSRISLPPPESRVEESITRQFGVDEWTCSKSKTVMKEIIAARVLALTAAEVIGPEDPGDLLERLRRLPMQAV